MLSSKKITRNPMFWALFSAASVGCILFTLKYFSKAMPIVNVNIKMSRLDAIEKASDLAKKFGWGPRKHNHATAFDVDQETKIFAELECGGQKTFVKMIKDGLYQPYQWVVRHFKEFEKNETFIKFTPEGNPYGFKEIISEDTPGKNLSTKEAQKIATQQAEKNWNIEFDKYKLVESSKEVKPSKRGDHTFVYERPDVKLGEGFYRLKIVVSGEKLTELKHFVKIPESFTNKYKEMRASNNIIAYLASFLIILLYLLGGCIIGLFFLFKERYVIFKTPFFVGSFVAFLFFINRLNVIPSAWMNYNTIMSSQQFFLQYLLSSFTFFLTKLFLFVLSFMAAESLTRKAFGNHISFWKIWSKDNSNSISVMGKTIGGYLLATFMLAYVVGIYLFSTNLLGWWVPSGELVDPNILSHYLPWLSSFTNSLGAGFWEECLFRAVPLSCAALLGKRFGKKYWWIAFAFILQAIIFGAAHANYPAQPAYARLVELILPSFMFAGVYLSFGLLPSIITHFIYDLILMSMPLFVSSASYAWVNQLIVVLLGSIPLAIILISRIKSGKWSEIQNKYLNKNWHPPKKIITKEKQKIFKQKTFHFKPTFFIIILITSLAGALSWLKFTPSSHNATSLNISQQQAIEIAKEDLQEKGLNISKDWQALPILSANFERSDKSNKNRKMQHRFIWQNDKKLYTKLLGSYLNDPQWIVRFVEFNGNLDQRAEEYAAFVNKDKKVYRIHHKIPENQKDEKLTENNARIIAHSHLVQVFGLNPKKLKEISAKSEKLKNRINWKFIFSNKESYPLKEGEARIVIKIDGNSVSDTYRYIHVPEKWLRQEESKENTKSILMGLCFLLTMFIILFAVIVSGKGFVKFSKSSAITTFLFFFFARTIIYANYFSQIISKFDPIKPFNNQLFQQIGSFFISNLFISGMLAIVLGLIKNFRTKYIFPKKLSTILASVCIGTIAIGINAFVGFYKPSLQPLWPNFNYIAGYYPTLSTLLGEIVEYFLKTSIVILFVTALNYIYNNWKAKYVILTVIFLISSLALIGIGEINSIQFWIAKGIILSISTLLIYLFFVRLDHSCIPIIVGVVSIANILQQAMFNAYQNVISASILSAIVIAILAITWFTKLNK